MGRRVTVLVTGGCGFIGSHLASRLLRDGHRVIVADNFATGDRRNSPGGAELIEADLSREPDVAALPWSEIDQVCHLAAQSSGEVSHAHPLLDLDVNVRGTFLLLQAAHAARVDRFVFAGSMAAYGNAQTEHISEDEPLRPLSCYGTSKACAESYVRWFRRHGLPTTVFRMFSVYGPGQDLSNMQQGMVSIFLKFLLDGKPVHVKGSPERIRDFVHVDDVVNAWCLALADQAAVGHTYNLASGRRTTVRELVAALIEAMGERIDYPVRYEGSTPDDQRGVFADVTRLRTDLGWEPMVSLPDGLLRTCEAARSGSWA